MPVTYGAQPVGNWKLNDQEGAAIFAALPIFVSADVFALSMSVFAGSKAFLPSGVPVSSSLQAGDPGKPQFGVDGALLAAAGSTGGVEVVVSLLVTAPVELFVVMLTFETFVVIVSPAYELLYVVLFFVVVLLVVLLVVDVGPCDEAGPDAVMP